MLIELHWYCSEDSQQKSVGHASLLELVAWHFGVH